MNKLLKASSISLTMLLTLSSPLTIASGNDQYVESCRDFPLCDGTVETRLILDGDTEQEGYYIDDESDNDKA